MNNDDYFKEVVLRGDPEAAKQYAGMKRVHQQGERMLREGRITEEQGRELEAKLLTELMNNVPIETYAEMRSSGRWRHLEQLAKHDGTRDLRDVNTDRLGITHQVMRDVLSDWWLDGAIDDTTYQAESRKLGLPDDLKEAIAEKDERATMDTYMANFLGEKEYRKYREDVVKQNLDAKAAVEPDETPSASDLADFRKRHGLEPVKASKAFDHDDDVELAEANSRLGEISADDIKEFNSRQGIEPSAPDAKPEGELS